MYLYFPNDKVEDVLGIDDSSNGMWLYPAHTSKVKKYFTTFIWEKMSFTFGTGQINFLLILLSAQ